MTQPYDPITIEIIQSSLQAAADEIAADYIIPSVFNRDVAPRVAAAVVEEAKRGGVARMNEETGTFQAVEAS